MCHFLNKNDKLCTFLTKTAGVLFNEGSILLSFVPELNNETTYFMINKELI